MLSIEDEETAIKVVILGNPGVGKTSLRRTYLGESFRDNHIKTIGADFSFKQMKIDDENVRVLIWDLAGQIKYAKMHPGYIRGALGALVVYDVLDKHSFHDIENWIEELVSSSRTNGVPILLVGNKIDLIEDEELKAHIDRQEKQLISKLNEKYSEKFPIMALKTSAKTGSQVNESFELLTDTIWDWIGEVSERQKDDVDEKLNDKFPFACVIALNELAGPKIVSTSPPMNWENLSDKLINSSVKLASTFDFSEIVPIGFIHGIAPWSDPVGNFIYFTFTRPNEQARGRHEMHVIGVVTKLDSDHELTPKMNLVKSLINVAANEYISTIEETNTNFITELDMAKNNVVKLQISQILLKLRHKIHEIANAK